MFSFIILSEICTQKSVIRFPESMNRAATPHNIPTYCSLAAEEAVVAAVLMMLRQPLLLSQGHQ